MTFDPARFYQAVRHYGHGGKLGIQFHGSGEDWVEVALPYDAKLSADPDTGILASGPIITLMDLATSLSIWTKSGVFIEQATLDLRVDYLRPAMPGKTVIGRGQCYRITRNIAFVRGHAHDGDPDDPVAHVAGTYMFTGPLS
ncbi:PaaI family thioesterase [Sphingobium boeckii]|uniref:Uncharacterized protein (TIGR00369 family) n=1 Tax=Sphingobium boeckii TaxID=1082345 RepID=A0A7W9AFE7_9SPHN|nr:PaaI family thioesterase [Sphingobium boeckii]MBB5684644.1 uncharacterized protein (TIGR00369 family) [Sphingobium boeckii]